MNTEMNSDENGDDHDEVWMDARVSDPELYIRVKLTEYASGKIGSESTVSVRGEMSIGEIRQKISELLIVADEECRDEIARRMQANEGEAPF